MRSFEMVVLLQAKFLKLTVLYCQWQKQEIGKTFPFQMQRSGPKNSVSGITALGVKNYFTANFKDNF